MMFCNCGGMLVMRVGELKCRSCGKVSNAKIEAKLTKQKSKKDIAVIENNAPDLPETDKMCPDCSHNRAYWWLIQTRSMDEPPTQFFRCVKCKHTWREYK